MHQYSADSARSGEQATAGASGLPRLPAAELEAGRYGRLGPIQIKRPSGRKLVTLPSGAERPRDGDPTPLQLARRPEMGEGPPHRYLGTCPDTYPLQKKRHSDELLRTIAHLRPRNQ